MVASASGMLRTKLTPPPVRADRILRPRLTEQFSASLERPLILVCAPPGYGKTTLLSEWFMTEAGRAVSLAWLSLDEDDNDPGRFLTYLVSTLATVSDIDGDQVLSMLQSPQPPPPRAILTMLINHLLSLAGQVVLVIDDYHLIAAQAIHDAVTYLLEHLPAHVHLVLISREDPPFPLARLRGRGQLAEIRADDLRFAADEVAVFLEKALGVQLSAQQLIELDRRTEGWIAGLQLASLAMKGRDDVAGFISAFTGSHRFILDYLIEEVLNRQTEAVQQFLLETSILNRLSGPLCNAVTGRTDSQAMLEQIERGNLFLVMLDDERYWFRYHHLFGEMLRIRLQRASPGITSTLHHRASIWLEQNGWIAEAVEHAFWAQDVERAASLVDQYSEPMWMRGELATVLRWLKMLPEDAIRDHPWLGLNYAFILTLLDDFVEAEKRVAQVEQTLAQKVRDAEDDEHRTLQGRAAAIRATVSLLLGHAGATTIGAGMQALAHLPDSDLRWRAWANVNVGVAHFVSNGEMEEAERYLLEAVRLSEAANDSFMYMVGLSQLSRMYIVRGRLSEAGLRAEQLLQSGMDPNSRAQGRIDRSLVRYERNDIQGALEDMTEARRILEKYLLKRFAIDVNVRMARLKQLNGDHAGARQLMHQAVETAQSGHLRQTFVSEAAWQTWLWLQQGDLESARVWAQAIEPVAIDQLDPALEFEHMTLARVQMAQGRLDDAHQLLTRLLSAAEAAGRDGRVIAIRVLLALTAQLQGHKDTALNVLERALSLAEAEGYVRTFVDEGAPMAELLRQALARGIALDYVSRLLAAFDEASPSTDVVQSRQWIGDGLEPLSERELEVLHLIAGGASNGEIAQRLVISIGTVKKHVNNIFVKLDARSRTQVVAIARQYDLL